MKFLSIALLISTVSTKQGVSCAAYGDPSCDSERGTECCGTATPDKNLSSTAKEVRKVCNSLASNHFTDPANAAMTYTFLCLPEPAAKIGA